MIVGLGLDVMSLERAARLWARWGERIAARVLTASERATLPEATARRVEYLAGRIAAKEAASKALGVPPGIHWRCVEVGVARPGPPTLRFYEVAGARADALRVRRALLTLSHDAGVAAAVVVLEADP